MYCIIMIGMPGSGKSTIGKLLANKLGINYVSSGDIARQMAKNDNKIEDDLNNGKLAPEEEMRSRIADILNDHVKYNKSLILDGFPRFVDQLSWMISHFDLGKIVVVFVDTSLRILYARIAYRNRADDKAMENRMRFYSQYTVKILDCVHHSSIIRVNNTMNVNLDKKVSKLAKEVEGIVNS